MKKKLCSPKRAGFSLITTMFFVAAVSALMAMLAFSASQRAFTGRRLANRIKATAYAEAGIDYAYSILSVDFTKRNSPDEFPETVYGEGSFELTLTSISNNYCLVSSVGTCDSEIVEVRVLLEDYMADSGGSTPGSSPPDSSAWEDTIFAAGSMDLGGNGDIDGTLHSNGTLKMNGNVAFQPSEVDLSSSTKISVNGNVIADGTYTAPEIKISGNKESDATLIKQAVPEKAFPGYDLTDFYNTALANGQVIDGDVKQSSDLNWDNVPGGVVWINGDMRISANAYMNCTVIATGNISITGNANWDANHTSQNHIISRDGNIKIAGNTELNGLLYATGDISLWGNARIYGQVMSGSDVSVNGNVEVINYTYSGPTGGTTGDQTPKDQLVGISGWQK